MVKINQRQLLTLILPSFSTEVPGTIVMVEVVRRFSWNELLAGERTIRLEYQQIKTDGNSVRLSGMSVNMCINFNNSQGG
jgi:hypothetical protein